jgi:hypothetical protein
MALKTITIMHGPASLVLQQAAATKKKSRRPAKYKELWLASMGSGIRLLDNNGNHVLTSASD